MKKEFSTYPELILYLVVLILVLILNTLLHPTTP